MIKENEKTVLLYAGEDVVDLLVMNRLIPEMVELGLTPVIVFPKKPKLTSPNLENEAVKEYGFYQHDILQDTIIPFLESKPMVLTPEDKLKTDTCYTAKQLAAFYGLHIWSVDDVNSKNHINEIANDDTVIGALSVRCMQIFKKEMIETMHRKGFFLNAHPGDLPNYRGVIPVFRAMLNGDKNLKWTLHSIDEGIDTGPKHETTSQKVDPKKSVFWHYNTNADNVSAMIIGHIQKVINGDHVGRYVQDRSKGNYFSYPEKELTDEFNSMGGILVEPRHKMEQFLAKLFVPHFNPHRDEFKFVVSKRINEEFGPKNPKGFHLTTVSEQKSAGASAHRLGAAVFACQ